MKLGNKSYPMWQIILNVVITLAVLGIFYNFGRIAMMRKYQHEFDDLCDRYTRLYNEYVEYKENSYVLLHYGCEK